jgi:hypothetical protein
MDVPTPTPAADSHADKVRNAIEAEFARAGGPVLGAVMAEAAMALRAKQIERMKALNGRLAVAKEALAIRTEENNRHLAVKFEVMEAARRTWEARCREYETERVAGQSACVPLQNVVLDIVKEINAPDLTFGGRVRQWDVGDHVSQPLARPD